MKAWGSPNASKNRAWSVPNAAKNGQDASKVATKCIRATKNEKKGGQERKMCQHGPNLAEFGPRSRFILAPPRKEMQYVNASINACRI